MRWQALQWHELQSLWLWLGLRWLSMDVLKRWHAQVDAQVEPQATADRTWLDGFLFDSSCDRWGGKTGRTHKQIAIALKPGAWRKAGLATVVSKMANGGGERKQLASLEPAASPLRSLTSLARCSSTRDPQSPNTYTRRPSAYTPSHCGQGSRGAAPPRVLGPWRAPTCVNGQAEPAQHPDCFRWNMQSTLFGAA